jgi:thymidylate synthase ThyX
MNVNLISYSQGVDGKSLMDQVAYAARVSNPANQNNSETAEKLVRYLINNQHWSPLEMILKLFFTKTFKFFEHFISKNLTN